MYNKIITIRIMIFSALIVNSLIFNANCESLKDKEKEINEYLNSKFNQSKQGAVILVAQNGKPFIKRAYGMANIEQNIPLTADHSLAIGSLTKQFTAMAIFILEEQGKLSIDDNISRYFPDIQNFNGIRIHHLLNHSSGIRDLFSIRKWRKDLSTDLNQQQTLSIIKNQNLEFVPGEKTKYSNSGYYLLGMIIEKVAKQSLNSFIRKNILIPINMSNTKFIDGINAALPTAKGYENRNGKITAPFKVSKSRFFAGGSLITTVNDLLKWDEALNKNYIISDNLLAQYFEPAILNNGEKTNMACGWEIINFDGIQIFGHGGGINGYICQVYRIPDMHIYIAVLSNMIGHSSELSIVSIAQDILTIILKGIESKNQRSTFSLSSEKLNLYKGTYLLPNGERRHIIVQDDKIFYKLNDLKKVELIPESKSIFRGGRASTIKFMFDEKGDVTSFEIHTGRGKPAAIGKKKN